MKLTLKTTICGAAVALIVLGASCSKDAANGGKPEFLTKAQADSLIGGMGELQGYQVNGQIKQVMQQDSTFSKEQFLKGFQYVMAGDTAFSYMAGMNVALRMRDMINRYEQMGIHVDPSLFINQFKSAVMADSVPSDAQMTALQTMIQGYDNQLREAKQKYDKEQLENSPEAKANIEAGKKYLQQIQAKDKDVKVTGSGIGYKITEAGTGKVTKTDRVKIKSTVKAIKGNNPQALPEGQAIPVEQLPEGLQESLMMLGKGGKGTFYIPGPQAFGVEMAQMMNIEPNVMVVYEFEIEDVEAAPAPKADAAAAPAPKAAAPAKK